MPRRLAPSAARMAISRWLARFRASKRFARLVQTIASTNALAPQKMTIVWATELAVLVRRVATGGVPGARSDR